jgi:hypothetical protein
MSTGVLSPGVKWLGRDVDHLPPSSPEVKNEWSCTCAVPISLHIVDRDSFTYYCFVFEMVKKM